MGHRVSHESYGIRESLGRRFKPDNPPGDLLSLGIEWNWLHLPSIPPLLVYVGESVKLDLPGGRREARFHRGRQFAQIAIVKE